MKMVCPFCDGPMAASNSLANMDRADELSCDYDSHDVWMFFFTCRCCRIEMHLDVPVRVRRLRQDEVV